VACWTPSVVFGYTAIDGICFLPVSNSDISALGAIE